MTIRTSGSVLWVIKFVYTFMGVLSKDFISSNLNTSLFLVARQQKYLRARMGGVEDEMDDEAEDKEEKRSVWGRNKNLYYNAENIDYEVRHFLPLKGTPFSSSFLDLSLLDQFDYP